MPRQYKQIHFVLGKISLFFVSINLTKNPIDRLAFLSGAKRVFFYIYTTIPIPNPKDTGKTGDIII